jgi:hypothetical protein
LRMFRPCGQSCVIGQKVEKRCVTILMHVIVSA